MKYKLSAMFAILLIGTAAFASTAANTQTIAETAARQGSFNTLVKALKAADLVGTLDGKGPFTVFAPTDEAFAKLPEGTLENLLKPENKAQLKAILTYHVVAGRVFAKDVSNMHSATTVNGKNIEIRTAAGAVMVDDAKVVQADIPCSNGVIHVIDSVLLPN